MTEIHRTNLRFLLQLKGSIGILNNLIHDNLALMAIAHFEAVYRGLECTYTNAGASGIDIVGKDRSGVVKLLAEVKTTLPDRHGRIRGPQSKHIEKDLDRLAASKGDMLRYLVLLSSSTKKAVQKQLGTDSSFPNVKIFNAFEEQLSEIENPEDVV